MTEYLGSISHAFGGAEMTPRVLTCSATLSENALTCPRGWEQLSAWRIASLDPFIYKLNYGTLRLIHAILRWLPCFHT